MVRRIIVWLHRWTGLLLAGFLILEGLTGSVIAFYGDLERLVSPQYYATPKPGAPTLGAATLAERAEALVPQAQDCVFDLRPDQFIASWCKPRDNPSTGKPYELGFTRLILDPWTGAELARLEHEDDLLRGPQALLPFIYGLHKRLALGPYGELTLGIIALLWTLDCFAGFYLTLPVAIEHFWRRWKPSFLIKWPAGLYRLNFDLHRASGLWLWPALFIFAWSSVLFNLPSVYEPVNSAVFGRSSLLDQYMAIPQHPNDTPSLDWRAALATGARLMKEQEAIYGFTFKQLRSIGYDHNKGIYSYGGVSSLDVDVEDGGQTFLVFDGDTGALRRLFLPTGRNSADTVSLWLRALHLADLRGSLAYRIFVCLLGLVIALLSATGVYIWWKKRVARKFSAEHRVEMVGVSRAEMAES